MSTCLAPAKINLSLRLLGKRKDGFHEIDTLMARLDLADSLDFHNSRTTSILCDTPGVPTDESNLVFRAVRAFEASYGRKVKQRITLSKRCPHGAGLGGGSSDAAATLQYLNDHLGTSYDADELASMGAELGSDVCFFLGSGVCRCTGRGEICNSVDALATWSSPIVVIKPDFAVSTAGAYKNYAAMMEAKTFVAPEPRCVDGIDFVNDLEPAVFKKFPILGMMRTWLSEQDGVRVAMMSGSGSSLFALTTSLKEAKAVAKAAQARFGAGLFCHCGFVNPQS